jgi:putative transposase
VAKSTVERLKKAHGWHGVTRGRRMRTTVPDPSAARAPDLVRRQFKAARPGQLHVADFTYVQMVTGRLAYTAFVIDAFAGLIPGRACALSKQTAFVEAAIRQAAAYRARPKLYLPVLLSHPLPRTCPGWPACGSTVGGPE